MNLLPRSADPPPTGPGSRLRVAEDVPFLGRTAGWRLAAGALTGAALLAAGGALSVLSGIQALFFAALLAAAAGAALVIALPAWLAMRREQWIVLNGARVRARIVACDPVGRVGNMGDYAVARIRMDLEVSGGGTVQASVRRVVYGVDRRDIAQLVGGVRWVYWHAGHPGIAVPEGSF